MRGSDILAERLSEYVYLAFYPRLLAELVASRQECARLKMKIAAHLWDQLEREGRLEGWIKDALRESVKS